MLNHNYNMIIIESRFAIKVWDVKTEKPTIPPETINLDKLKPELVSKHLIQIYNKYIYF